MSQWPQNARQCLRGNSFEFFPAVVLGLLQRNAHENVYSLTFFQLSPQNNFIDQLQHHPLT